MPLDQPDDIDRALSDESRMPLGEHLEDLRRRVILALVGPVITTMIALYFGRGLVAWLVQPLMQVLRSAGLPPQTYNFTVTGGFIIYLKVSIAAGIILASPWIVYQIWLFVQSGLYRHERRAALTLLPFSTLMAALGVVFLYYILLPLSLVFFVYFSTSYPPPPVDARPANPLMQRLMDMTARSTGGDTGATNGAPHGAATQPQIDTQANPQAGAQAATRPATQPTTQPAPDRGGRTLGQLPVRYDNPPDPQPGQAWIKLPENELRVYFANKMHRFTASARQSMLQPMLEVQWYINYVVLLAIGIIIAFQLPVVMLILGWSGLVDPADVARVRKYCVAGCFALGALFTPQDPISMVVLAVPLWGLFELGLGLMRLMQWRRQAGAEP